jgi:hypothetical protein
VFSFRAGIIAMSIRHLGRRPARMWRARHGHLPAIFFNRVRTPVQVNLQALHRIHDRLVGKRTGLMHQTRAFHLQ